MMGTCLLCAPHVECIDLLGHLADQHPVEYGEGLATWPDGTPIGFTSVGELDLG